MNHDEWMSEGAAIVGLVLVGFGVWWGDAAAAALICIQIMRDAWTTTQQVIADLMDEAPNILEQHELEELPQRVREAAKRYDWVTEAAVRLREHGRLITGDVFVVPREDVDLAARVERAAGELTRVDWRLHALTVMPVSSLEHTTPPHPG